MDPFLKILARGLLSKYGTDIQDVCIVFPGRRAGLFFRKYLSGIYSGTLLSPQIFTINEFFLQFTQLRQADPLDLVSGLYRIYSGLMKEPETFDEFYHWGEIMISDFDDIDKYLIDPDTLFRNIIDLKEIDTVFDYLSPAQKETLERFWGFFRKDQMSTHKESFLRIWKLLLPCYHGLKEMLKADLLAWEGMIYRDVAESLISGNHITTPWKKVIFAGFNALNNAEKTVFRYFLRSGTGEYYWDYDHFYTDNPVMEAGRFIRENLKEFPPMEFPDHFRNLGKQEILIHELPSDLAQAKYLHKLLDTPDPADPEEFHDTAVVLGNEQLLMPVLSSLPEHISDINVTMGYQLSITPVYSFIERILLMQKKLAKQTGKRAGMFYFNDVLSILNHQYIRILQKNNLDEIIREIHENNYIYIDPSWFRGKGFIENIFVGKKSTAELTEYLVSVLLETVRALSENVQGTESRLEREYIYNLLTRIRKIKEVLGKYSTEVTVDTFSRLLRKVVSSLRIPFEGEPLAGLQIMGLLETRSLDFNNLIILSVNEGIIPKAHPGFSFIPGSLRYAFGLPVREHHDAIYAYYFYRLLQRARKVHLLYNSRTEDLNTGEKSRYLYQLLYSKGFSVSEKSIGFDIAERSPLPITIGKSGPVMKILEKYQVPGTSFLSPSSLNNYLDCRLKFYFSNIAGLKERAEVTEEIETKDLGILLHETMFRLYDPFKGKMISAKDIENLLQNGMIKSAVDSAFRKEYYKTSDPAAEVAPEGQNLIYYEVINKYAEKILHIDLGYAPFTVIDLEHKYQAELRIPLLSGFKDIRIAGKIDRIDRKDRLIRIIDYKTGEGETTFRSLDKLFLRDSSTRNKGIFQTLVYSWIYSKNHRGMESISPGLYLTKKMFSENFEPDVKMNGKLLNYNENDTYFSEKLLELVSEIFSERQAFDQTTEEKNCSFCEFAEICHRNAVGD